MNGTIFMTRFCPRMNAMPRAAQTGLQQTARQWPWLLVIALAGCQSLSPVGAPTASSARGSAAQIDTLPDPYSPVARLMPPVPTPPPKDVPVGLDTVFRLAEEQNGAVQLARARLEEAVAGQDLARKAWLPQVYVGP